MAHAPHQTQSAYERGEISTSEMGRALRRGWWLPVLLAVFGGLLGWLGSTSLDVAYTSTASGVVVSDGGSDATEALAGENLAKSRAVTYASLSANTSTASAVIDRLDLDTTPEAILDQVKTSVPTDTSEVRVTATAQTSDQARELAGTWVDELSKQVENLGSSSAGKGVKVRMEAVGEASTPQDPSSVSPTTLVAVGTLLGLLAGALVAIALERRRTPGTVPWTDGAGEGNRA